jgi:hypothetical protein
MPHAEKDIQSQHNTMGEPLTNGEKHHSLFISHLTSYPLVSDSLSLYIENPYGAKSINLVNEAYKKFLVPVEPYFKTPYSYVAPYLAKADSLGDKGLSEVDTRFPIVKEETSSLKEKVKGLPFVPYTLAVQGKDYVFSTYEAESKKNGEGIVPFAKTVIGTELKIAADTLAYVSSFLLQKKEEGTKFAEAKYEEGKKFAETKIDEFKEKTSS